MIIDIAAQIGATSRKVEQQHTGVGEVVAVTLQRSYEAANSPEAQEFNVVSIKEWVAAIEASGTADTDSISAAQQVALAQFAPDLVRRD